MKYIESIRDHNAFEVQGKRRSRRRSPPQTDQHARRVMSLGPAAWLRNRKKPGVVGIAIAWGRTELRGERPRLRSSSASAPAPASRPVYAFPPSPAQQRMSTMPATRRTCTTCFKAKSKCVAQDTRETCERYAFSVSCPVYSG